MTIGNKEADQICVVDSETREVLAVISDTEIIEHTGVAVEIDFED